MDVKQTTNLPGLVIYSYLKDGAFTAIIKNAVSSKTFCHFPQSTAVVLELLWTTKIHLRISNVSQILNRLHRTIGTLRSDNGDVHENVAAKYTLHSLKLFRDYPKSPCYLKKGIQGGSEERGAEARFSKVQLINGPGKLSPFTLKIEVSSVLHLT